MRAGTHSSSIVYIPGPMAQLGGSGAGSSSVGSVCAACRLRARSLGTSWPCSMSQLRATFSRFILQTPRAAE